MGRKKRVAYEGLAGAKLIMSQCEADRADPVVRLMEAVIQQGFQDLRMVRRGIVGNEWVDPERDLTSSPTILNMYTALGIDPDWAVEKTREMADYWHGAKND